MPDETLDRLLTALEVRLHASSVCAIQQGESLAFAPFEATTLHFVLRGSGSVRVGEAPPVRFAPRSIIIVPARQPHVVQSQAGTARAIDADAHCGMLADGLVLFTAGDGTADILLVCGQVPLPHAGALGLFDLLREPMVEAAAQAGLIEHSLGVMREELAAPGYGTQAIVEALMKQCLVVLLRERLRQAGGDAAVPASPHPRLARAVLAILEHPAAPHSVESLAGLAGMSRASFAEHFHRAFGQGPIEFVQKARLRIAARLLTTTDLPVKVIAQSIGYAAPTGFTRAFRALYGADPSTYRASGGDPGSPAVRNS